MKDVGGVIHERKQKQRSSGFIQRIVVQHEESEVSAIAKGVQSIAN